MQIESIVVVCSCGWKFNVNMDELTDGARIGCPKCSAYYLEAEVRDEACQSETK